ncbi:MAG: hypothetical protein GZ091_11905 [Paludibacter sp.]|nr:hypothetical protein [Paludibacter sp.]
MKRTKIPFIKELNNASIDLSAEILEEAGQQETIEVLNWANEYPYRPITLFYIARSNDSIFIKYSVRGTMLRAIYSNDQDPVHDDSCVEFFCKPEGTDKYSNFEFNCIGTCSATNRKGRNDEVIPFSNADMKTIERFPSIGRRAFNEMEGMFEWELTVKIPFKLMGIDSNHLPEKIRANFYKCADGTDSPHFVSWSPIHTEKPDFHRPEYFGELLFEN